jgi:pyruvate-formate lyase
MKNMNSRIKHFVKKILLIQYWRDIQAGMQFISSKENRTSYTSLNKMICNVKILFTARFIRNSNPVKQSQLLLKKSRIKPLPSEIFFYSLDTRTIPIYHNRVTGNITPDYTILLAHSLNDLCHDSSENSAAHRIWTTITQYLDRCISSLPVTDHRRTMLARMKIAPANGLQDALQRVLFANMLFWQERHMLIGVGHLDKILFPYYEQDKTTGVKNSTEQFVLIKDFLQTLHGYYLFKSNELPGDTGQIIILAGVQPDGTYLCNDLTYLFIKAVEELKLPDPKLLVRTAANMPPPLMNASVQCIKTGIGCPIFANDDCIIPKLQSFGYTNEDSYGYGTAACWEPLIIGKSSDVNNVAVINFAAPFADFSLYDADSKNFSDFLTQYENRLNKHIEKTIYGLKNIKFDAAPILSLFIHNSIEKASDIIDNTALYHDYGILTVGLSNTVNALYNIRDFVFEQKLFNIQTVKNVLENNYTGFEQYQKLFRENSDQYETDSDDIQTLANHLFVLASEVTRKTETVLSGKKLKIGLSSPTYIDSAVQFPATPDGRKKGEPFNVHISCDNAENYSTLFNFASKLDYNQNRFNGNVVDFMTSPSFIENNFDKFTDMICTALKSGVFEMQINVVSSKMLIDAQNNPSLFPHLIVRVWGFSAYFNDLPDSYKKLLIQRARDHERAYH